MQKLLFLFFILPLFSSAQTIQRKFTQKDGLSSYNVRSIVKDNNGFLWISTQDGLNKFDGNAFETFTKDKLDNRKRIDFTDCRSLYIDSVSNQLWVMGSEFGINLIDCNTSTVISRFPISLVNKNSFIICFYKAGNSFWIGTSQGLYSFNTVTKTYTHHNIAAYTNNELRIEKIGLDAFQNLWIGVNNYGALVIDCVTQKVKKAFPLQTLGFSKSDFAFTALFFYKNLLTIGSFQNAATIQYDNDYNIITQVASPLNSATGVRGIFSVGNKIYQPANGLYVLDEGLNKLRQIKNQSTDSEDWLKSINTITPVDDHVLAFGCNDGVLLYNITTPSVMPVRNNLAVFKDKLSHIYNIEQYNNKELMVASERGLFVMRDQEIAHTIAVDAAFFHILKLADNLCIVSNKSGIKLCKGYNLYSLTSMYPEFKGYEDYQLNAIISYNTDTAILSTENGHGLLVWDRKKHLITPINTDTKPFYTKSNTLNTIFKDSEDRIWALSDYAISLLNFKRKETRILEYQNEKSTTAMGLYFDMAEPTKSEYWINCYGNGLIILNDKLKLIKKISAQNGISNNGLYKIFSYKNLLLTTSNNGLSFIDKQTHKIANLYSESDDIHGNAFEEACGRLVNNTAYVGGINGYTAIDLEKLRTNLRPPVFYFTQIITNANNASRDTSNLFLSFLEIPNNVTQTKIYFRGLNYENPARVTYAYRIKQLGNEWISVGTQNFIDLIGTKPNTYNLEVKSANEDGVESESKILTLRFLPKWYQTLLFKILLLLSIAGILYLLYSFRVRQLQKIINVRKKISSDLHDDLSSTLSSINMYSESAQMQPNNPIFVASIRENTREVLEKLDDIVWATNPKNDKFSNLIERMDGFARPLLQSKNIRFVFDHGVFTDGISISENTRQSLFLIFKEAINNICKYAQCNTCTVTLALENRLLLCSIIDDGIGFDSTLPTDRNGLLNMRERVKVLKGKINIQSALHAGTTIALELPA